MEGKLKLNAEKLKSLRKEMGLSQEALADQCFSSGQRVSLSTIKRAELGRPILYRTAKSLASFFNTELPDITFNHGNIIFGRDYEIQHLEQTLNVINQEKCGRVIYIRGVAGIGKTHLITTFKETLATRDINSVFVTLRPDRQNSRGMSLKSILLYLLGLPTNMQSNDTDTIEKALINKGFDEQDRHQFFRLLDTGLSKDIGQQNENENKVLIKLIESYKKTLVITVEDIHWASDELLQTLRYITANILELPVFLLLTSRIENDPIDPMWRSSNLNTPFNTIDLPPLNKNHALSFIKELDDYDNEYSEQCIELSQGNPLFLQQLLFNYAKHIGGTPATVTKLVMSRLDNLSTEERMALSAAALIGDIFSLPLLCYMLDVEDYDCSHLTNNFFITQGDIEEEYEFCHELIRHGILDSLGEKTKRKWHKKLALWFKDKDETDYAYHLARSHAEGDLEDGAEEFIANFNKADSPISIPKWSLPFGLSKVYKSKRSAPEDSSH